MKQSSIFLTAALVLLGCNNAAVSNRASVLGPVDLVIVDKMVGDSLAVLPGYAADGTVIERVGYHGGMVFVTSTDTNELRVFEPYREGTINTADWARAPNPLETLSIPVLDQPQILVADEGVNEDGRVTGAYVYAARRSGAELSVVSTRTLKQVGGHPMPLPAPLMAVSAWMNLSGPSLPATTTVFVATWDGSNSRVIAASLPTNEEQLAQTLAAGTVPFTDVTVVPNEPIKALQVVPPRVGRTLDGAPFCDTAICLAIATRKVDGSGRSVLLDPVSGVSAPLGFGRQMRDFAVSLRRDGDVRLYGVIDEQSCSSASCGGVLSVELTTGTTVTGFPLTRDVAGEPMLPLNYGDALILGLTIAPNARIGGYVESFPDSGVLDRAISEVGYTELGAFSTSNGAVTYFNAQSGMIIDYDPRRVAIEYAQVRRPEVLDDGGVIFARPDAGAAGTLENYPIALASNPIVGAYSRPWREFVVGTTNANTWKLTLGDGYLDTQALYAVTRGNLPGLSALPDARMGTVLAVPVGSEAVVVVGDIVRFFDGIDDTTLPECGRALVTSVQSGQLTVDAEPATCQRNETSTFTVKASGSKSIVLFAELEGYLGRAAPGDTVVYRRRLVAQPLNVSVTPDETNGVYAPRDAMTIVVPAQPPSEEGAFTQFGINSYISRYRTAVNPVTTATPAYCFLSSLTPSQIVIGNIAMGIAPRGQSASTAPLFEWWTFGVVPSGNALITMRHQPLGPGAADNATGVQCRQ
ncbi:MAG: hypothetical protein ACO1OB_04940 [Archangium sp.]